MSIFDAYNQEYSSICREISKNIAELRGESSDKGNDRSSSLIRQIEGLLQQANDLIKQMEIEARSHDAGTRKALGEKVSEFKKSLISLRTDFEKAKEIAQRSVLIGNKSGEQRQRLLDVNDK